MQKIWYCKTSRDNWGPIFSFQLWDIDYKMRLAGNPILLLEWAYIKYGGTEFMKCYKSISGGSSGDISKPNVEAMKKAKQFCEDFFSSIIKIQELNKSLLVIYKD